MCCSREPRSFLQPQLSTAWALKRALETSAGLTSQPSTSTGEHNLTCQKECTVIARTRSACTFEPWNWGRVHAGPRGRAGIKLYSHTFHEGSHCIGVHEEFHLFCRWDKNHTACYLDDMPHKRLTKPVKVFEYFFDGMRKGRGRENIIRLEVRTLPSHALIYQNASEKRRGERSTSSLEAIQG